VTALRQLSYRFDGHTTGGCYSPWWTRWNFCVASPAGCPGSFAGRTNLIDGSLRARPDAARPMAAPCRDGSAPLGEAAPVSPPARSCAPRRIFCSTPAARLMNI